LFETRVNATSGVHMFAVTRDGTRFLIRESLDIANSQLEPLYVVTNWTSLVR
jgi:hypothetical protein